MDLESAGWDGERGCGEDSPCAKGVGGGAPAPDGEGGVGAECRRGSSGRRGAEWRLEVAAPRR